jgi:hypothetical protein
VIVAIHTQSAKDRAPAFVREQGLPYLVAVDKAGEGGREVTIGKYRVDSYPDYYLVDRKGALRFADLANREVERAIEHLLAEK